MQADLVNVPKLACLPKVENICVRRYPCFLGQANSRGPVILQSYPPCGSYQSLLNKLTGYRQAVIFVTPQIQAGSCGEIEQPTQMGRSLGKPAVLAAWTRTCVHRLQGSPKPLCQSPLPFLALLPPLFFFFFPQVLLLMKCHMGLCCSRKCYFYCMLLPSHPVCTFSFQSWIQMHPQPAVLELFLLKVNENISC